jgi:hypothetical protein
MYRSARDLLFVKPQFRSLKRHRNTLNPLDFVLTLLGRGPRSASPSMNPSQFASTTSLKWSWLISRKIMGDEQPSNTAITSRRCAALGARPMYFFVVLYMTRPLQLLFIVDQTLSSRACHSSKGLCSTISLSCPWAACLPEYGLEAHSVLWNPCRTKSCE